jgi:unsaturated rhamnogalacturonyl hydrolase
LLAGAEMIRLLENPSFEIQYKNRTYHYVPKEGRSSSDRKQ